MAPLTRIEVRISDDMRQRIRELAQRWPGHPIESYVVRYLLEQGLHTVEQHLQGMPGPAPLPLRMDDDAETRGDESKTWRG
ncbi:MAG: hypothetical protein OWU84_12015 [Firmicutes bacterium]|nr:hypothetical protein [Bacillota bacterium]